MHINAQCGRESVQNLSYESVGQEDDADAWRNQYFNSCNCIVRLATTQSEVEEGLLGLTALAVL